MKENAHDMFFGSWYNLEDGSGVYAIVNSLDNKKYIGSTYYKSEYKKMLSRQTKISLWLYLEIKKYTK